MDEPTVPPSTNQLGSPYIPIDKAHQEIRLLELVPGTFDEDLVINVRVKRLARKRPLYNALSYAWGKEPCTRPALVNGRHVPIGRNLDCALRHLRTIMADRVRIGGYSNLLWIDALCINQDDVLERNQQVQMMDKIYSSADDVIVWLGPERPDSHFILDRIWTSNFPATEAEALPVLKALKRLCRRPWFGRLWIAQELALSYNPALLIGHLSLRWHQLCAFVTKMVALSEEVTVEYSDRWSFRACQYFDQAAMRLLRLEAIKTNPRGLLLDQLMETAQLLALDPRDRVFGLLSICRFSSRRNIIVSDYSKTVHEVYSRATVVMLQEREFPYAELQLRPPPDGTSKGTTVLQMEGVPTWVLDLTLGTRITSYYDYLKCKPRIPIPVGVSVADLLRKIKDLPIPLKIDSELAQLSTLGAYLGTIAETSKHLLDSRDDPTAVPPAPAIIYDTYQTMIKPRHIAAKTFMRALIPQHEISGADSVLFEQFLQERIEGNDPRAIFGGIYAEILGRLHIAVNKVLFVTAEKQVGLAHHPDFDSGIRPETSW